MPVTLLEGNSCNVEYTVIDDENQVKQIWRLADSIMESDAKRPIYTNSFSGFLLWQSEKP